MMYSKKGERITDRADSELAIAQGPARGARNFERALPCRGGSIRSLNRAGHNNLPTARTDRLLRRRRAEVVFSNRRCKAPARCHKSSCSTNGGGDREHRRVAGKVPEARRR